MAEIRLNLMYTKFHVDSSLRLEFIRWAPFQRPYDLFATRFRCFDWG